ncbi:MAG TPA: carboxypeptidase regulatory-like domain-containing protein, partial [Blastocatellia bacterium]|nr:carboxypeptidase regulatory-like domain-containing protein [Blastocatellia bacterium]
LSSSLTTIFFASTFPILALRLAHFAEQQIDVFLPIPVLSLILLTLLLIIASRVARKLISASDDLRLAARVRPRATRSTLLITIVVAGSLWLTTGADTVAVFAQADVAHSTIKGKVTDQLDAAVSDATITVISAGRGVVRSVKTDDKGAYQVPLLQPGTYELRVEASGFQLQVLNRVVLTVGQIGVYDIKLQIGQITEAVSIGVGPTLVETERTQQSDTVERGQIATLPNLSRNFTFYIFTLPGIADVAAARVQQSRVTPIPTSGFSVGAGNGRSNYISIDGGENDSGTGSLRIKNLSVEAVQEFQVNRNAFAAEYGFTAGTAVNVVTRGGTNAFHGTGYVFYRSEKTAARDPLNRSGQKPFEQRVSPGFTIGGPLVRNQAFFFTSFEALKYDIARIRSYTGNPSLLGPTAAQSVYLQNLISGPDASDATRRIAAQLRATLATASYPTTLQLLRQSEGRFTAPSRTYNWTTRLDYKRGERDFISGRFTLAKEDNDLLRVDNVEAPSNGIIENLDDYTAVGTWNHIFSDRLVNQLRIQFVDDDYRQISRAPGSTNIVIAGLINYGRLTTVPLVIKQKRYQFEDILSLSRGSTNLKVGASYRPVDAEIVTEIGLGGVFQFAAGLPLARALAPADVGLLTGPLAPPADTLLTSLQAFNLGLPAIWQQGFGNPGFHAWQHNLGAFGQLSWKATPRLTFNLGARLNYDGEPLPFDQNISLSPRLGFAWDPFGKGETVIRGGFGTFYAPVGLQILLSATLQSGSGQFISLPSRTLQDGPQSPPALWAYGVSLGKLPLVALTEADVRAFGITPGPNQANRRFADAAEDYNNPYTVQASLGLSQQLGRDLAFEVSLQMYHGVHLPIALEANYRESGQFVTVPGVPGSDLFGPRLERIDPSIAQKILHSSEGNSIYYGMTTSLLKGFGEGFQFRASYTYSKALDDVVDFSGGTTPYLPTRRFVERGLSAYDLRHSFVVSGSLESPLEAGPEHNWIARALADITLSPIITLRNGFPFNLYIGRDVNGDLNTTDRPFYAPRNSGRGENFYSVDLRMSKIFHLRRNSEAPRMEFIVEATNLLNHVNYLRVNDIVCGTTAQPGFINGCDPKFLTGPFDFKGMRGLPPTAPLGFVTAAPQRQFQFGLKFEF